jgi:hypothetical protein
VVTCLEPSPTSLVEVFTHRAYHVSVDRELDTIALDGEIAVLPHGASAAKTAEQ